MMIDDRDPDIDHIMRIAKEPFRVPPLPARFALGGLFHCYRFCYPTDWHGLG